MNTCSRPHPRRAPTLRLLLRDRLLALSDDRDVLDELANGRLCETAPRGATPRSRLRPSRSRAVAVALAAHHLTDRAGGRRAGRGARVRRLRPALRRRLRPSALAGSVRRVTLRERVAATAGWERWALAACAVVAVGALLPWASFLGASVYGIEGDGVITLIAAAAATALVLWRRHPALAAVLGVIVLNRWFRGLDAAGCCWPVSDRDWRRGHRRGRGHGSSRRHREVRRVAICPHAGRRGSIAARAGSLRQPSGLFLQYLEDSDNVRACLTTPAPCTRSRPTCSACSVIRRGCASSSCCATASARSARSRPSSDWTRAARRSTWRRCGGSGSSSPGGRERASTTASRTQRVFDLLAAGRDVITQQLAEQQSILRELETS